VAFVKFSVVTVDDPALNAPVRFNVVPVAFVSSIFPNCERPDTLSDVDVTFVNNALIAVRYEA
jgi:hypothetical protein